MVFPIPRCRFRLAVLGTQVSLTSARNPQEVVSLLSVKELSWKCPVKGLRCLLVEKVLHKLEQRRNIQSTVSSGLEDLCECSGFPWSVLAHSADGGLLAAFFLARDGKT